MFEHVLIRQLPKIHLLTSLNQMVDFRYPEHSRPTLASNMPLPSIYQRVKRNGFDTKPWYASGNTQG